jgi:hypothetical protein
MSQHFVMCLLHITLLQFQIFIKKHLALHYMVFCLKYGSVIYINGTTIVPPLLNVHHLDLQASLFKVTMKKMPNLL